MSRSNQTRSSGLGFSYKVNSLSNAYQVLQTKVLRVKDSTRDIPKEKRSSLRAVQLKASFPTKREENEQTLPEKEKKKTKKRVPKTHKKGKGERNPLKPFSSPPPPPSTVPEPTVQTTNHSADLQRTNKKSKSLLIARPIFPNLKSQIPLLPSFFPLFLLPLFLLLAHPPTTTTTKHPPHAPPNPRPQPRTLPALPNRRINGLPLDAVELCFFAGRDVPD